MKRPTTNLAAYGDDKALIPSMEERKSIKMRLVVALVLASIGKLPDDKSLRHGLCDLLDSVLLKQDSPGINLLGYYVSSHRAKHFPGFSGENCFPVKSSNDMSPETAYFNCCGDHWSGTYGTNRKAYAKWLARRLRQEVASGNYSLVNPRIR